jgi:hypothetical protein
MVEPDSRVHVRVEKSVDADAQKLAVFPHGFERGGIDRDSVFLPLSERAELELTRHQNVLKPRRRFRRLDVTHGFVHQLSELHKRAKRRGVQHDEANAVSEGLSVL